VNVNHSKHADLRAYALHVDLGVDTPHVALRVIALHVELRAYEGEKNHKKGGLNCVFGNFFFYVLDNCPQVQSLK